MKKTIAKIMAAAMVLSTVVAPNALAAGLTANITKTSIASISFGGVEVYGDDTGVLGVELADDNTAVDLINNTNTSWTTETDVYVGNSSSKGAASVGASIYVNKNNTTDNAADANSTSSVTNEVTTVTSGSAIREVAVNSDSIQYVEGAFSTSKVAVNGEYNDTVVADDMSRWYRLLWTGATVVPQFNPAYTTFDNWMTKLRVGGVVRGTVPVVNNAGTTLFRVTTELSIANVGDADDIYWNGIVKLKGSNDTFIPIRVRYQLADGTVPATALAMEWTGNNIKFANGTLVSRTTLANRRVELVAINSYDMDILKSDVAKGKNLLLNDIYVFDTADYVNDNGLKSAIGQTEDWGVLNVNENISTTSVGKITTIHSQLFKGTKEKFVKAEYAKFINNGAFRKNKQLKKAYIGNEKNLKKVNSKAFYDCKKLATVKLSGKALKNVGSGAFKNCKSNMIFKIKGNSTQVKKAWAKIKKQAPAKAKYAKI